jgi:ubiquinone/menaquinone biosynthesis C-methylase UbiE
MLSFRGKSNPYMLIVGMTGVKMGDRLLQIGCSDGGALAAVAAKVGLSGRALAVVPDAAGAARVRKGAERQGVLVDTEISASSTLPAGDADFDLVVIDDAQGQFAASGGEQQLATVREAIRVLKPGGRLLVISGLPATGLAAMFGRGSDAPPFDATGVLETGGCRFVRLLAEREGLRFVEGTKARTTGTTK